MSSLTALFVIFSLMLFLYNEYERGTDSNQRPHAPQTRTLTGLSYTPNCGCKGTAFFGICKYSLYFFTLKVHLFMQGIDETNKSIPYIQRETYWCVF